MADDKLQIILNLVDEYIKEKHSKKEWVAGKDWVQYAGPYFNSNEYVRSIKTLLNEWLVLGSETAEFEKTFPEKLGKKFGIVTNSGSSSNLLMMASMLSKRIYNFPKGTKIIIPVAGFPTTLNPLLQLGFEPVFIDIELNSLNIDTEQLEQTLLKFPNIKIITFAHVLGNPPNMNKIMEIVSKYKLMLLEDCCDALGSTYDGKPLGSFGELASCSFYPAHHITGGEGGFVACNTSEQERVLRSLREWGRGCYCNGKEANLSAKGCCGKRFSNWLSSMPETIFDHKYVYDEIGYNLKPIELQCSMLLEQLKKLPEIHNRRKENFNLLYNIFKNHEDHFILPKATELADVSWFAFPLTIKDRSPFNRFDICGFLESNKIQTRNYFGGNLLLQPAYQNLHHTYTKDYVISFKNATKVTTDTFFLGTSPVLKHNQIEYISEKVNEFFHKI